MDDPKPLGPIDGDAVHIVRRGLRLVLAFGLSSAVILWSGPGERLRDISGVNRVAGATRQADRQTAIPAAEFARIIQEFSEEGGYFWSENLISNETSYLHIVPKLRDLGASGGAYIGVGPEQNFTYIAKIKAANSVHCRHPPAGDHSAPDVQGFVPSFDGPAPVSIAPALQASRGKGCSRSGCHAGATVGVLCQNPFGSALLRLEPRGDKFYYHP